MARDERVIVIDIEADGTVLVDNSQNDDAALIEKELAELADLLNGGGKAGYKVEKHVHKHGHAHGHTHSKGKAHTHG